MADWASLILRACLGIVFIAHGLQAAFGMFGGPGVNGFTNMLSGLGFKPAVFWAYLGAYVELIGGLLLILGILTRFAALLIFIFMLVAVVKVHLTKGFFIQSGGFEYNFVIMCICIVLMIIGAGRFGINKKF